MSLTEIYRIIKNDLETVENRLQSVSNVDIPLLSQLLEYTLKNGGKRIRPSLTLLAGKFHDYDLDKLIPMAAGVELLHNATLVHDDIVDNSELRRGKPSISNAWGQDCALLLGDYLFAKAGYLVATTNNLRVIYLFAETLMTISSGELAQIGIIFDEKKAREHYYNWIGAKTACLFATSTESGAILSNASETEITALKDYGYYFGMAFQIVDDVLDFIGKEAELGKPTGSDLAEGAVTLPSILYAERYPDDNLIKAIVENRDKEKIMLALEKVITSPVIDECMEIASDFCLKAQKTLELLPDCKAHEALSKLAIYIQKRNK
jgi:heptaprenyl diphosphate synthase/octaprenyl-diphosphate synthase